VGYSTLDVGDPEQRFKKTGASAPKAEEEEFFNFVTLVKFLPSISKQAALNSYCLGHQSDNTPFVDLSRCI
jgi:hypothetical protein